MINFPLVRFPCRGGLGRLFFGAYDQRVAGVQAYVIGGKKRGAPGWFALIKQGCLRQAHKYCRRLEKSVFNFAFALEGYLLSRLLNVILGMNGRAALRKRGMVILRNVVPVLEQQHR